MSLAVRWTERASNQLVEAACYLEQARAGTGLRFLEQVEALVGRAVENPKLFPAVPGVEGGEARRGLVRRYGYWVIYETAPEALVILSVWHGARRPEGWRTG